ncbi:MAG: O-antigen ligase family protein [Acidobacteriota bacterium]
MIYIRPGEIVPAWADVRITQAVGAVAALSALSSLVLRPRPFANLPIDWCFLGFCVATILSNPANGWVGGGYAALASILPLIAFYMLIRVGVETSGQLRGLIVAVVLFTSFQAVNGIIQYHTGVGLGNTTAFLQSDIVANDDGAIGQITRIRGTGIFNDPNDLAMSLVIVLPFLFTFTLSPESGFVRKIIGLGSLGVISYALLLTQSRGGIVGVGALSAAYFYRRFGRVAAVAIGVVVVGLFLVAGSGRLQRMESGEESAQGRIQAWAAGLEMFRARPVLGVGYGQFTEHNNLVAHNSFVHTFSELGFVGEFFLVGMFYWLIVANRSAGNLAGELASPLRLDVWASGIGVIVCICFLSRQYSPVLYVPLALSATRLSLERPTDDALPKSSFADWVRVLLLAVAVVGVTSVAVRLLAVWSG